jgi:hypothetical protein
VEPTFSLVLMIFGFERHMAWRCQNKQRSWLLDRFVYSACKPLLIKEPPRYPHILRPINSASSRCHRLGLATPTWMGMITRFVL